MPSNDVADFNIKIDGKSIKEFPKSQTKLQLITVELGISLPDRIELVFGDHEEGWAKAPPKLGAKVEIELGYVGKRVLVCTGAVAYLEGVRDRENNREFRLLAYGPRYLLQRGVDGKAFVESPVGDSVKAAGGIASKATSFKAQLSVEGGDLKLPYLLQANESGAQLAQEWAGRLGLVVVEDGQRVRYGKADFSSEGPHFIYQKTLEEARLEVDSYHVVGKVVVTGSDIKGKKQFKGQADKSKLWDKLEGTKNGIEELGPFGEVTLEVSDTPVRSDKEAEQLAIALLNERAFSFVTGNVTVKGSTDVKAASTVFLEKLGERLSGKYFVPRVRHVYKAGAVGAVDSGFRTYFEVSRPAWGWKPSDKPSEAAGGGSGKSSSPGKPKPAPKPTPKPTPKPKPTRKPKPSVSPKPVTSAKPAATPSPAITPAPTSALATPRPSAAPSKTPAAATPIPSPTPVQTTPPSTPSRTPLSTQTPTRTPTPTPTQTKGDCGAPCPDAPRLHFDFKLDSGGKQLGTGIGQKSAGGSGHWNRYAFRLVGLPKDVKVAYIDWWFYYADSTVNTWEQHQRQLESVQMSFPSRGDIEAWCLVRFQGCEHCVFRMHTRVHVDRADRVAPSKHSPAAWAPPSEAGSSPPRKKIPYDGPSGSLSSPSFVRKHFLDER